MSGVMLEVKALLSGQSVLNVTIGTSTGFGDKQKRFGCA
jgi:hypothetical protein